MLVESTACEGQRKLFCDKVFGFVEYMPQGLALDAARSRDLTNVDSLDSLLDLQGAG
jgi:hypothetical protein